MHLIDGRSELHGAWMGPCDVRMRTSTQSYVLWTSKRELESPASLMRSWLGPVVGALKVPLGCGKLSRGVNPVLQERPGFVERVHAHRRSHQGSEFRTHRKGNLPGVVAWVQVNAFFPDYSSVLVRYALLRSLEALSILGLLSGGRDGDVAPARR